MPSNSAYTDEYFDILFTHDGDIDSRRKSNAYMQNSTAIVHNEVTASTYIPRLFNQKSYNVMKRTAETMHQILCKVIQHYLDDPQYRRLFTYDPRLEELMLIPRGYDSLLPMARVDTFTNENTFQIQFCEINGDGSSGMNENREVTNAIKDSACFRAFDKRHRAQSCELFDSWVNTFLNVYSTYVNRVEQPRIAIVDYLEHSTINELNVYADTFRKHGYDCIVADVRKLSFDGEHLLDPEGQPIHAVWRRCVTNDVLEFWDESQPFLDAVRAQCFALIGSFAGHIVHDKQLFLVLNHEQTFAFLEDSEVSFIKRTVPFTTWLDDEHADLNTIRENRKDWIIKPTDHYGADEVYAGAAVSRVKWEDLIDQYANEGAGYPFLAQRYIEPYKTKTLPSDKNINNIDPANVQCDPVLYNNMNGLYLYDGVFQGVFSRLGPEPTISSDTGGVTAASIWVDVGRNREDLAIAQEAEEEKESEEQEQSKKNMRAAGAALTIGAILSLIISFVAIGFFIDAAIPVTTQSLSEQYSGTTNPATPFSHDDLVDAAMACREYTVGNNNRDALFETLHAINDNAHTVLANANDEQLAAGDERLTLPADALSHLDDVHSVVETVYNAFFIIALVALACCLLLGKLGYRRLLGLSFIISGAFLLVAFAALGIWAMMDFNGLFAVFHSLFFAEGSWTFSANSLLITMYPTDFWMGMGAVWLLGTCIVSLASIVVGIIFYVRSKRKDQK